MELPGTLQGRPFGPEQLAEIRALIGQRSDWSRYRLSRELARLWAWRTPQGQLKDMAARTFLLKLHQQGWIELPLRRMKSPTRSGRVPGGGDRALEQITVEGPLDLLLPLRLLEVSPLSAFPGTGKSSTESRSGCWKRSWTGSALRAPATARPIGFAWARPKAGDVKVPPVSSPPQSRMFMSCLCIDTSAVISARTKPKPIQPKSVRQQLVEAPVYNAPDSKSEAAAAVELAFTLVIQIDAWNIRERDHWGQTQKMRKRNREPDRWHWVYTATCFQLHQRCCKGRSKDKMRAIVTERSYVATRGGVEPLMKQLCYEARVRGLGRVQQVLVIADGAVWIWNLVADRFKEATQRLDPQFLPLGGRQPTAWGWQPGGPPMGQTLAQVAKVMIQLEDLKATLTEAAAIKVTGKAVEYYANNQQRMKYKQARKRNEPVGSGAIESRCRQLQCRMKRCGQFWSTAGDEALLCLETFWRNQRWELLFPHSKLTAVSNN